jgi:hypothetical protein
MATYEEIYGKRVKEFDSDPTLDSSYEGQVWYDKSSGTLRSVVTFAAWSSGASATNSPRIFSGGDGPINAGWMAGGGSASPNDIANTEEYNGSGWSAGGDLPGATYGAAGVGPQTAALFFGGNNGSILAAAYEYDGSSWASPTSMPTGRQYINRAGTQTAALASGGANPNTASNTTTSEYDGSSWTAGGALPVGKEYAAGTGTLTAALLAGGYFQPGGTTEPTATLYYDGSSWTSAGTLPAGRWNTQGFGTQTDAVVAGGQPAPAGHATGGIRWNGTSWSTDASLANARNGATAMGLNSGATSSGWVCGGPGLLTEEYNKSINTITAAAWASTPSLGTARRQVGGFGHTTTTAVCACGQNPPALSNVEEYDGSSWSEVNNAPIARVKPFACGVLTAGLIGGGESGPSPVSFQSSAEYDGTNWTASPSSAIGQDTGDGTAFGIQTAALLVIGSQSPNTAVKYYDGSTWTAGPAATPTSMASASGNGTQTNGLVYGSSPGQTTTLEWDGSSWTSGGALTSGRHRGAEAVGAPSTAALYFGGNDPSRTTATEGYDGTSWSSRPSMATARRGLGGAGIQTAALAFAGYTGSDTAVSEEFTGETETVTAKTLTTS